MKTVIIPAEDARPVRLDDPEAIDLAYLSEQVGGYIEAVALVDTGDEDGMDLFLNEEGKLEGLRTNLRATLLAHSFGSIFADDYIVGDVVVTGPVDGDGEQTGLSDPAALFLATTLLRALL
jgi:hypothetical protein